jgi:hypothetical protein
MPDTVYITYLLLLSLTQSLHRTRHAVVTWHMFKSYMAFRCTYTYIRRRTQSANSLSVGLVLPRNAIIIF